MPTVRCSGSDGSSVTVAVTVQAAPAWTIPTPRAKTVTGVTNPVFQTDTMYVDCPGLVIPVNAQKFTVVGGISLPTTAKGWDDFWIGGRPNARMNAGPRTDGGDLCQVKRWPATTAGKVPNNGIFAFIDYHDLSRPVLDPPAHPDGIQMMAGTNLLFGGSLFRNMGEAAQPWFLKTEGPTAGGGPIEDITLTDCSFSNIAYYYPVHIRSGAGLFPKRITLRNVDLGGKNITISRSSYDSGLTLENVTNGIVKIVEGE